MVAIHGVRPKLDSSSDVEFNNIIQGVIAMAIWVFDNYFWISFNRFVANA